MANSLQKGFLLTRQAQDLPQGLRLTYWLKGHNGPIKLTIDDEKAIFFVEQQQVERSQQLLTAAKIDCVIKALTLTNFAGSQVHGFYFSKLNQFYKARELFQRAEIKCYEDDIRPEDRFLMERFITGTMAFSGQQLPSFKFESYADVKCKAAPYQVNLTMLSIDIECAMDGSLYSIGCYSDNVEKVFMIGAVEPQAKPYIDWVIDECDLLLKFVTWLTEFDPDIIIGWNVINFDFKLLQKRCDLNNIKFAIGRDGSTPFWRQNKLSPEQNFILIAGRVVLDGIDLLKTATYNFASYALDNVAKELLGIGKAIDDVDNRAAEITRKFIHEKQQLAHYNLEDCRLVWLIFEKTKLLDFAILRSSLTGLELDRVGGSVAAFTNLYLPKLHRSGYIAPNMGDGVSDLISPGGFVMDSIPGLYKNVLVLDFKSLYPSIIRTFKIDPLGLIIGLNQNQQQLEAPIPGFDGAFFSREQHFLPDIIEQLWAERDKAKQQKNAPLSQAIKIIMNSFYGVLGSTGCRFFDPRLSGSITKRSHQLLNTSKDWIEAQGYTVIYGDTDSIFVSVGSDKTPSQCQTIGTTLMDYINHRWQQELKDKYNIDSKLDIEFETHFHQFLMPTVRGANITSAAKAIGTKKRYAGTTIKGGELTMTFKGMETVRSDWTELSKDFQQELYKKIFNNESVDEYIRDIVARTYNGEFDAKLKYRKRLRRKLSEYVKNVPPHVKAARHADKIYASNNRPLRYQNKGWIEYFITKEGAQTAEHIAADLDYEFYVNSQLKPVADDILPFKDTSFDKIIGRQIDLF